MPYGPVLVIGGCGFIGYHIIKALKQDSDCGPIFSVSRDPTINHLDGVTYHAGSITDQKFVLSILQEIKPQVIIHAASPRPSAATVKAEEYRETNVGGTVMLLECAAKASSVQALVYCSTVNVLAGNTHDNVTENGPQWQPDSNAIPYWRSKAEAERAVLRADDPELRTTSLPLPLTIGERDHIMIPAQLDTFNKKQTGVQLGDNKNLMDVVSPENSAQAHILAVKALLYPESANGKVGGEAFNITDGNPLPFWDIARMIWRAAGDTTELKDVTIIPGWAAMGMATVAEWSCEALTFGVKKPGMTRQVVGFCTNQFTYNIDKARNVLGYKPVARMEEVIKEAVAWELRKRTEEAKAGEVARR